MKLSFSTIGCPAYSWVDIYPMAKDLGFDGIEVRGAAGRTFAPTAQPFLPRQRQRTRELLERLDLEISCFSTACTLANEDARNDTINELTAYIELASDLGCPYVRGAKGPDSFDCSGFVYWCLKQAGANPSYMTSVRWRTCSKYTRIESMDQIKRGDILVFSGSSASTGHVGIYLGGGMIDASSSGGCVVKRGSVFTNYWTSHFLMAYRIWD